MSQHTHGGKVRILTSNSAHATRKTTETKKRESKASIFLFSMMALTVVVGRVLERVKTKRAARISVYNFHYTCAQTHAMPDEARLL